MNIDEKLRRRIESDLCLDWPFVKGRTSSIRNCWHFYTDGSAVDQMFYDDMDFIAGMNRVYIVVKKHNVVILAFSLMDTHLHFILYGDLQDCIRFMHDYVNRTSRHISVMHGDRHKLASVRVNYQKIDSDLYLKTAICYTIKNAPVGGIQYMGWDYPWSSGPLYFRKAGVWSSPSWLAGSLEPVAGATERWKRETLKTRTPGELDIQMSGQLVFPGEYVAYEIVERLFKTCKSYNFFLCTSKESDIDTRGGAISMLSIPMQEMRQHRDEVLRELFGAILMKNLDTGSRIRLAKALKSRYNSSVKQIVRLCGLVYEEVKDLI